MPSGYNGNGSIPTLTTGPQTRRAIAASTNASPIVVQTSVPHGYNTGDTVEIEGHLVNTAANAVWQITVGDSTHFALNGSTGNGVGGTTGRSIDYEIQPAFLIPAPSEAASMVTLAPVLEGLANLAPFLNRRTGTWRIYDILTAQSIDTTFASSYSTVTTLLNNTFTTVPGGAALLTDTQAYDAGDIALIYWTGIVVTNNIVSTSPGICLGAALPGASALSAIEASLTPLMVEPNLVLTGSSNVADSTASYTMIGTWKLFSAQPTGLQLGVMLYANGAMSGGPQIQLINQWNMIVVHMRPN